MKRFRILQAVSLAASAALLFGCQPAHPDPLLHAKDVGGFSYENTEWGMTPEEALASLDKSADDFTEEVTDDGILTTSLLMADLPFRGQTCPTTFTFVTVPDSDLSTLRTVSVLCPIQTDEAFTQLCTDMETWVKKQGADYQAELKKAKNVGEGPFGTTIEMDDPNYETTEASVEISFYTITSTQDMTNLPVHIKDGYNAYCNQLIEEGIITPLSGSEPADYIESLREPLSRVIVQYINDIQNNTQSCQVTWDGRGIAEPVSYSRALAQS